MGLTIDSAAIDCIPSARMSDRRTVMYVLAPPSRASRPARSTAICGCSHADCASMAAHPVAEQLDARFVRQHVRNLRQHCLCTVTLVRSRRNGHALA